MCYREEIGILFRKHVIVETTWLLHSAELGFTSILTSTDLRQIEHNSRKCIFETANDQWHGVN